MTKFTVKYLQTVVCERTIEARTEDEAVDAVRKTGFQAKDLTDFERGDFLPIEVRVGKVKVKDFVLANDDEDDEEEAPEPRVIVTAPGKKPRLADIPVGKTAITPPRHLKSA